MNQLQEFKPDQSLEEVDEKAALADTHSEAPEMFSMYEFREKEKDLRELSLR